MAAGAGDGAGSPLRRQLGVALEGREGLQALINVHFSSPGLAAALRRAPAMLYFVYARTAVLVLVAHDLSRGAPLAPRCRVPHAPLLEPPIGLPVWVSAGSCFFWPLTTRLCSWCWLLIRA